MGGAREERTRRGRKTEEIRRRQKEETGDVMDNQDYIISYPNKTRFINLKKKWGPTLVSLLGRVNLFLKVKPLKCLSKSLNKDNLMILNAQVQLYDYFHSVDFQYKIHTIKILLISGCI